MDENRVNELIKKQIDGLATEEEINELNIWYRKAAYQEAEFPGDEESIYVEMLNHINEKTKPKTANFSSLKKWTVAATATIVFSFSLIIYVSKNRADKSNKQLLINKAAQGVSNRAMLTLADGRKISLNEAANGQLATQNGVQVVKTSNGQLVYTIASSQTTTDSIPVSQYNTIETPAGGQYILVLPDKSKVWLNAMSSIRFPVSFEHLKERRIELKGEAYFEVMHNEAIPFRVVAGRLITEDIGTAFNINAYSDDDQVKMTLVKGSAKVTAGGSDLTILPGQQASYGKTLTVNQVVVEDEIAWKDGFFRFEDETLENIMKAISRWYDVKVVFEDVQLKNDRYGAVSTRFDNISTLLDLMQQTGSADFKKNGNTIIISRKSR
ncbi:FecR family protein [Mucilaginibacter pocheonensis]|uniref:Ferric-dicitrate binding protein FerR (Iron transport regulator) n=1 Tax=Mucilaginibacter pocheonensis TaxID=398050 RepID=A0ABU1TEB2_9SPHI|nr:FecR domain-containing protein [Mucilaginibacter pocheonensis]MDR6943750.1 ferric-dicitrate binding protein FerR (iron transport regulator) [Mucilaginibacter pocheonensis]